MFMGPTPLPRPCQRPEQTADSSVGAVPEPPPPRTPAHAWHRRGDDHFPDQGPGEGTLGSHYSTEGLVWLASIQRGRRGMFQKASSIPVTVSRAPVFLVWGRWACRARSPRREKQGRGSLKGGSALS